VVVNQFGQLEEEVALFLVLEAVFLAEAEFLGDARDAERLAGKAGAEDVVRRDGVVRHAPTSPQPSPQAEREKKMSPCGRSWKLAS
jgi:hypothetical protein